jgi:glutamate dehydrogenase (NAD(P)+)/glutamate dehydrogenase (NADP+)
MTRAFRDVLKIQMERQVSMRLAANIVGVGRVAEAVKIRGLYP